MSVDNKVDQDRFTNAIEMNCFIQLSVLRAAQHILQSGIHIAAKLKSYVIY